MSRTTSAASGGLEAGVRRILAAARSASAGQRRDGPDTFPLGGKAKRTRSSLLRAALEAFTEQGYLATSVRDIHERAGVSLGTYYLYFRDKAEAMETLVAEAVIASADSVFPQLDLTTSDDTAADARGPRPVVAGFVRNYAASADFFRVWEEATHVEPAVARFRHDVGRVLDAAVRDAISAGQAAGTVRVDVDADVAARALSAMVDRTCYLTFVVDGRRDRIMVDQTIDVLSDLWGHALGYGRG